MAIKINEIEIKIKLSEKPGSLKATIGLNFGDFLVKGFRIQDGQFPNPRGDNLWLLPPSYPAHGRYHPIFYMPDKKLWQELADKVWDAYYQLLEDERNEVSEMHFI